MPVIRDITLSLKANDILRQKGFRGHSNIRPEIEKLIVELLDNIEENHLLTPAIAYEICYIADLGQEYVSLKGRGVLRGLLLPSLLVEANELAAVVATIGPNLERQVTNYNDNNEPLLGLLLDSIGNTAIDLLIAEACKLIAAKALESGYQMSSIVTPGMSGFPIAEQRPLLEMVPAREIGVSLTFSGMMAPRKSTSMVMGIGVKMKTWTRTEGCARCNLSQTCHYKIHESIF